MNVRSALAITRKDIADAFRSLRILSVVVLPVAMSLVFGALFSGMEARATQIVVYDPGGSRFVVSLAHTYGFRIVTVDSAAMVGETVLQDNALGGLVLPADIDSSLGSGAQPTVAVYANPGFVGSGERLKDLVQEQAKSTLGLQPPSVFALQVLETHPAASLPFDVESYLLSLFLGMSLCLTGVMVPSMLLAEEKEKHTIRPLLVAPVSVTDLAVGKTLAGLFYVLVSSFVIVAVNGGLSSNLVALGLTVLVSCLFVVQVGLLLGSVFNDVSSLNTWSSVVILPLLLPAMLMPLGAAGDFSLGPLFSIMRVIPTYYATDALGLALSGVSLLRVAPDLMILLICTILCFLAAERLLRRIQRT